MSVDEQQDGRRQEGKFFETVVIGEIRELEETNPLAAWRLLNTQIQIRRSIAEDTRDPREGTALREQVQRLEAMAVQLWNTQSPH